MPDVSVVIPCYNGGETLMRAISSVEAQSFDDLEIVVVDDGSTDPLTLEVLKALPEGVRVVRQENKGLPAARNTAIRQAKGKYILPLDSDDYLAPDYLEKTLKVLETNDKASFVFSSMMLFGDRKGELRRGYNFFEQLFTNQLPYCLLMPKALWETVGGYDESMRSGYEDWEYNIRLGKNGYYGVCVDEPLFNYSVSNKGMLKSTSSRLHARLWQGIQKKHPDLYNLRGLFRIWRQWRNVPSAYPPYIYFFMYILSRIVPMSVFNWIFNSLRMFSASERKKYLGNAGI